MGYMRHHAIIVTSWNSDMLHDAQQVAKEILAAADLPDLTSPIILSYTNGYGTFIVAPDGSKESWGTSNSGDDARDKFIEWLDAQRFGDGSSSLDWAEVQYGDEDGHQAPLRSGP